MQDKTTLTKLLRGLVDLIAEEAEHNPDFAERLDKLLAPLSAKKAPRKTTSRKARAEPEVPDVYREQEKQGEEFHYWLRTLQVSVLHAIIRKHDLDSARRTMKWNDTEKLARFIADKLRSRLGRGASFVRRGKENEY